MAKFGPKLAQLRCNSSGSTPNTYRGDNFDVIPELEASAAARRVIFSSLSPPWVCASLESCTEVRQREGCQRGFVKTVRQDGTLLWPSSWRGFWSRFAASKSDLSPHAQSRHDVTVITLDAPLDLDRLAVDYERIAAGLRHFEEACLTLRHPQTGDVLLTGQLKDGVGAFVVVRCGGKLL